MCKLSVPEVQTEEWPLGLFPCSVSGSLLGSQDLNQWSEPDLHRPSETGTPESPPPGEVKHNEQQILKHRNVKNES